MGLKAWSKGQQKQVKVTVKQEKIARELAHCYRNLLRLRAPYSKKLLDPTKPIEQSQFYRYFVAAAKICEEMGAEPMNYVRAQFDRLGWKKKLIPYPSQLSSENAVLGYVEWASKNEDKLVRKEVTEKSITHDEFDRERRKVKSWAKRLGMRKKAVLRKYPNEFSEGFLRACGVWEYVRERVEG